MRNKFIVLDTSCIIYFMFLCLHNITTFSYYNSHYRVRYNDIYIFIPVLIFISIIIQEKITSKTVAFFNLIKLCFPIMFFSYLYRLIFTLFKVLDLFDAEDISHFLSISIPILMLEFILEQIIYNFLRDKIIK
uniref:Uncharacterized protein n=1 Tax=Podoviridae sp. ctP1X6 TaxID=2825246 RepID=A0A8S5U428_9CAUD|nr:MAG TPA: hypothetical protein [Podoviridae sp. ctP1X6]